MRPVESLLLELFRAHGLRNPHVAARKAADEFDRAKHNERIVSATRDATYAEVAVIYGISRRHVERIVSAFVRERRAARAEETVCE